MNRRLTAITGELSLDLPALRDMAAILAAAWENGLKGDPNSLKMQPSLPTGNKAGLFLTLDFGGSSVRTLLELLGQGRFTLQGQRRRPLRDPNGFYNMTARQLPERSRPYRPRPCRTTHHRHRRFAIGLALKGHGTS